MEDTLTLGQLPWSSSGVTRSSCLLNPPNRKTFLWKSLFPEQLPLNTLDKFFHTRPLSLIREGGRGTGRVFHCCCSHFWKNLTATYIPNKILNCPWMWVVGVVLVLAPRCNLHVSCIGSSGRAMEGSRLDPEMAIQGMPRRWGSQRLLSKGSWPAFFPPYYCPVL